MGTQVTKIRRKWAPALFGVLLTGMAYATLVLYSEPTYAAECNAALCDWAYEQADWYCNLCEGGATGCGGVGWFDCPRMYWPGTWYAGCGSYGYLDGNC